MITKPLEPFSEKIDFRLAPSMVARLDRERLRSGNAVAIILRRAIDGYLKPIEARENRKPQKAKRYGNTVA